jgi:hypothetical protein
MQKEIIRSEDLGQDWFAQAYSDGSMTVRNCEKGLRIDLPVESVNRLNSILAKVREGRA